MEKVGHTVTKRDANHTLDEGFHLAYAAARSARQTLAPIFILLGDELIVHHRGEWRDHVVRPRDFHTIKTVSHAPIALYTLGLVDGYHRDAALALHSSLDAITLEPLTGICRQDCQDVVRQTLVALDDYLDRRLDIASFASRMGDVLLRLRRHATGLHLNALDACVCAELARMSEKEHVGLQVVVAGVHQAREKSVGVQYFRSRLSAGCPAGERILYGEGVRDEQAALELVSLQRLD